MIKAKITGKDGRPIYLFGLSEENVRRMRQKMPVLVDLALLGGPNVQVAITWGETEEEVLKDLEAAGFKLPRTS